MIIDENCKEFDSNYTIDIKIGQGGTARVYLANHNQTNDIVVVKILDEVNQFYLNEVKTLSTISHKNIIQLIEYGLGKGDATNTKLRGKNYLVLECACKGELFGYLSGYPIGFGERYGRYIFKEIVNGLSALHNSGIAHRDLKTDNILITGDYGIKLADFGFSKPMDSSGKCFSPRGTPDFVGPEIFNCKVNEGYLGVKADIFSLGVTLFNIVTKYPPFRSSHQRDQLYRLIRKEKYDEYKNKIANYSGELSNEFWNLFFSMVNFEPKKRPTLDEIKMHPWFTNEKEYATQEETILEFQRREPYASNLKQQEIDQIKSGDIDEEEEVVRGIEETSHFTKDMKIKKIKNYGDKMPFILNGFVLNGKVDPCYFMNKFANALENNSQNADIQYSQKSYKLNVIYNNDENDDEEENEEEEINEQCLDENQNLVIKISLVQVNEMKFMLLFHKINGKKSDYLTKVKLIKKIVSSL